MTFWLVGSEVPADLWLEGDPPLWGRTVTFEPDCHHEVIEFDLRLPP